MKSSKEGYSTGKRFAEKTVVADFPKKLQKTKAKRFAGKNCGGGFSKKTAKYKQTSKKFEGRHC